MNNPSPLFPQGSLLEQKNKGRTKVKIAVFFVLAIHGIGLLALLMQGCHKEEPAPQTTEQTNTAPAVSFAPTNVAPEAPTPAPIPANPNPAPPPEPPVAAATDYTIVAGDNYSTLSKKFHVSVAAIVAANPGVEPTKLQLGQKIHIPAPAPAAPTAGAAPGTPVTNASGETTYTVKSGDNLINIAKTYGTSLKAIRAANNLKTDSIKVGQKLTIPAKAAGATPAPDAASGAPTSAPAAK